jgi:hypothetical protein
MPIISAPLHTGATRYRRSVPTRVNPGPASVTVSDLCAASAFSAALLNLTRTTLLAPALI